MLNIIINKIDEKQQQQLAYVSKVGTILIIILCIQLDVLISPVLTRYSSKQTRLKKRFILVVDDIGRSISFYYSHSYSLYVSKRFISQKCYIPPDVVETCFNFASCLYSSWNNFHYYSVKHERILITSLSYLINITGTVQRQICFI